MTTTVCLVVHGAPRGKGRPRFVRKTGVAYTPQDTMSAEQRVQGEWIAAGRPTFQKGEPLMLTVQAVEDRPKSHRRADGRTLSALGMRTPIPVRRPDLDNIVKLALDALNGLAFPDDAQVVALTAQRRWARPGEPAHTRIEIQRDYRALEAAA